MTDQFFSTPRVLARLHAGPFVQTQKMVLVK